jgi:hypothetical protein
VSGLVNISTERLDREVRVGFLDNARRRTYVRLDEAAEIRFEGVGPTMARLFEKVRPVVLTLSGQSAGHECSR